jgi:hypothetical protein
MSGDRRLQMASRDTEPIDRTKAATLLRLRERSIEQLATHAGDTTVGAVGSASPSRRPSLIVCAVG